MPSGNETWHSLCAKYIFSVQIHLSYDLQPEGLQFLLLSLATEDEIISLIWKEIYPVPIFSLHCNKASSKKTRVDSCKCVAVEEAYKRKRLAETQYIFHVKVTTVFLIADAPFLVETPQDHIQEYWVWGARALGA